MFGMFKPKAEKIALKIERLLMVQEAAYESEAWGSFIIAGKKVLPLLNEFQHDGSWSEEQFNTFLEERGLVKSMTVPGYREKMIKAQRAACAFY